MKKVEAIIREDKLKDVIKALEDEGFFGMTVTAVMGRGKEGGMTIQFRGRLMKVELLTKVKIEVVVDDKDVDRVVKAIISAAKTGEVGDGKIFIIPIEEAIRIRTEEKGTKAL
ncbi:MAG: P-II family nitrogen regulator [Thermococcus sp.]|uniref:P-II family nitrogen regulator n=1 Tax=Thermococcus sp. TaxID=35749 RepID=UPI001DF1EF11|nr:P-II family nitrogen regulator [Thermococcus sp.]MBO8173781.1 P-II family nitrogen regulator [Thermococcus sp.]